MSFFSALPEHALENFKEVFLGQREILFDNKDGELLNFISGLVEEKSEYYSVE